MVGKPGNPSEADVIQRILSEVATTEGSDVFDLPPLGKRIDADALVALVESPGFVAATFSYCGYEVTVSGGTTVDVTQRGEATGPHLLSDISR